MRTHIKMEFPVSDLYIQTPIPMEWLGRAAALPGKALNVAVALWWIRGMSGDGPVSLTHEVMRLLHVSRETASEALERMERAGLVSVVRAKGKRHEVTILAEVMRVARMVHRTQETASQPQPAVPESPKRRTLRHTRQA